MGQGGFINVVNATTSTWRRTHQHSFQMNSWNFPGEIRPQTSCLVYVEWSEALFSIEADDGAEAAYTLSGSNKKFQIRARARDPDSGISSPRYLQVFFENLQTAGNPKGSVSRLGWIHDGIIDFILVEISDQVYVCTTSNLSASWMEYSLALLGDKRLDQICIPGSHNSGMSRMNGKTAFASECNTLTQSKSVYDQLVLGIRYLDLRPVISAGRYFTGHYTKIPGGLWQGSNGQSIGSIIRDINRFTHARRELVILKLSHSLNTDVGDLSYRPFDKNEWGCLFERLEDIRYLHMEEKEENKGIRIQLTERKLDRFIAQSSSTLIVADVALGSRLGRGFYSAEDFSVYDSFSDTNDLAEMVKDQIDKMNRYSLNNYFQASWTLTQSGRQAAGCSVLLASSIRELAHEANQHLAYRLYPSVGTRFPNIISVDDVKDDRVTMLALAVNQRVLDS